MLPSSRLAGHAVRLVACLALIALALFATSPARAGIIKEPGNHPKYSVELEPHFVFQWNYTYYHDDGLGLGLRASIPLIDNGPISKINNSLAIGFGFDWAHFDNGCYGYYVNGVLRRQGFGDCSANHFWFPVVAQWNFFFTPVVSVFGEAGLAIQHVSEEFGCGANIPNCSDSFTRVRPFIFQAGPRFIFGETFALTIRVGVPYLSIGASFLL